LNVLSNESIEVVLQWVDKFDTAPKNKEVQYTNTSKILGKKNETTKNIGIINNVEDDMFSNFEIPSEESVEEKEEQVKNDSNKFSRLEFNKLNDKEKDTPKEDQKEKETKIDTHRHDLFDDVVIKKNVRKEKKH